jgi:hypothetical protein
MNDQDRELCPLQLLIESSASADREPENRAPFVVRVKRFLKRRLSVRAEKKIKGLVQSGFDLMSRQRRGSPLDPPPAPPPSVRLEAGDQVRVRPLSEIETTLDRWRSFKGLGFLKEMEAYCGTEQRVLKRVERFMDERDYRFKKASGVVLLDGVTCSGTASTGKCDRACFFFWREEWLTKIS